MKPCGSLNPVGHVAVLLFSLNVLTLTSVAQTDSFDAPLKSKLWISVLYRGGRVKLPCYFYPTSMVKENDERQKGAE
jgi:hypothetical protein